MLDMFLEHVRFSFIQLQFWYVNPFPTNIPLLYPLKTSKILQFFYVLGGIQVKHWLKLFILVIIIIFTSAAISFSLYSSFDIINIGSIHISCNCFRKMRSIFKDITKLTPCRANQWTGFYIISASVMKELRRLLNRI